MVTKLEKKQSSKLDHGHHVGSMLSVDRTFPLVSISLVSTQVKP